MIVGLILSTSAVFGTIGLGIAMRRTGARGSKRMLAGIIAVSCLVLSAGAAINLAAFPAKAADSAAETVSPEQSFSNVMGFIGMALATGLACVGAGIAVGSVG